MGNRFHDDDDDIDVGFDLDFVGDGINAVGDVATSAWDGAGDIVKAIPGGSWAIGAVNTITGPVGDFVKGPMRDFARTGLGETIFRAFSVAVGMMAYAIPAVGFTLAFLAWSIPGLAKGDDFVTALVTEFVYRVEYVITVFAGKAAGEGVKKGVDKMMSDQLKRGIEALQEQAAKIGITPQTLIAKSGLNANKLAQMAGIREDVAAYAIQWFKGTSKKMFGLINAAYNADGTMKPEVKKVLDKIMSNNAYPPDSPCAKLQAMAAQGITEESTRQIPAMNAAVQALKSQCEEWQLNEAIRLAGAAPGPTLGKRKKPSGGASTPSTKTPCQNYEAAIAAGQKPAILAALKAKCDAYSREMAAKSATLAASTAVTTAPVQMTPATESVFNSETNQKSAIAGVISGAVATGGALLAGLSAGIAIPVGLSFAAGGAIATKFLSKPKAAG